MVEASESIDVRAGGVRSAVNTNYHIGANFRGACNLLVQKLVVNSDSRMDHSLLYIRQIDYVSN